MSEESKTKTFKYDDFLFSSKYIPAVRDAIDLIIMHSDELRKLLQEPLKDLTGKPITPQTLLTEIDFSGFPQGVLVANRSFLKFRDALSRRINSDELNLNTLVGERAVQWPMVTMVGVKGLSLLSILVFNQMIHGQGESADAIPILNGQRPGIGRIKASSWGTRER